MDTGNIKDVVKNVIAALSNESPNVNESQIEKIWESAAGKKLAAHSKPVSFKTSRLVVNVDSSGWLYELTMERARILKRLKKKLTKKPVKEIQFRIGEVRL